jgi:PPM family protein phosphatase
MTTTTNQSIPSQKTERATDIMSAITIASATHIGRKSKENQDYHAVYPTGDGKEPGQGIMLVLADGMGGLNDGATASKLAVEILLKTYYESESAEIPAALENAALKANAAVIAESQKDPLGDRMGSTLTAVVIRKDRMYYVHVGDSRGYIIHDDQIRQFTEDHSFVASLVKAGVISEEDALDHPDANLVTRAIGIEDDLQVDVPREAICLQKGQYVLLCCDGLYKVVPENEMLQIVNEEKEPRAICKKLIDRANENGGPDNITVVLARIEKTGLFSRFMNRCTNLVG